MGFEWTLKKQIDKSFEQRIENLRAYKEKHGHVNVKKREDESLYCFCIQMRRARNNPEKSNMLINEERIASLDALGFDWSTSSDKSFDQRIVDLQAYKEKNRHVNVKMSEDKSLYDFCQHTRRARKHPGKSKTIINEERIASLDALGFEWNLKSTDTKSFARQTDRPQPSKKRKQRGQRKIGASTKKNHVRPKCSAKNDKGYATSSSDQMEAPVTVKDAAALLDPCQL